MSEKRAVRMMPPIDAGLQIPKATAFILDTQTRNQLRQCFTRLGLEDFNIERGDVRDAIRSYSEISSPELLIIDISNSDMPLSKLETLSNVCSPDIKVVVIGDQDNVGLYRNLMQYGVSEYLVKPLPADLLYQTLHKLNSIQADAVKPLKAGKNIGVIGSSGGVGATTLLAGLSDVLSRKFHRRVMLLDLNLHDGDLGFQFGLKSDRGLLDLLEAPERIDELFIERVSASLGPRLDLLFGEEELDKRIEPSGEAIDILLKYLSKSYHFVMLDVMKAPTSKRLEILSKMDVCIIVMDNGISSLNQCRRLFEKLGATQGQKQNLVVLNQPRPTLKTDIPLSKIESIIGQPVDFHLSYDGRNHSETSLSAKPASQGRGKAPRQIMKIAQSLAGPITHNETKSLFGKMVNGGKDVWQKIR